MDNSLKGQTAIVTGGSRGYGAGIAEALKQRGSDVWITASGCEELAATAQRLGVGSICADVASGEDWDRVFDEVLGANGRVDILVNNAGGGICIAPLEEQTDEQILKSITVNLTGKILGCKRAAKVMKAQKSGTIVNISSVCARQAWPGWSTYSAAKAGVVSLSKCLYTELREYGVRVTTVIPSWGATGFTSAANLPPHDAETMAECIKPSELGELVAYVAALPPHLEMQDVTLWPMVQEIMPL